jgi:hypothetical protein
MSLHHVPSHSALIFIAEAFVKFYKFQTPVYRRRRHASWHVSRYQISDSDHWLFQTASFYMNLIHIYPLFGIKTYYSKLNLLGGKHRVRVPVHLPVLLGQFRWLPGMCHKCSTASAFRFSLFAINYTLLLYAQRSVILTALLHCEYSKRDAQLFILLTDLCRKWLDK